MAQQMRCWELMASRVGTESGTNGVTSAQRTFYVVTDAPNRNPFQVINAFGRSNFQSGGVFVGDVRGFLDVDPPKTAAMFSLHPWFNWLQVLKYRIVASKAKMQWKIAAIYGVPEPFVPKGGGSFWTITGRGSSQPLQIVDEQYPGRSAADNLSYSQWRKTDDNGDDGGPRILGPRIWRRTEGEEVSDFFTRALQKNDAPAGVGETGKPVAVDIPLVDTGRRESEPIDDARPSMTLTFDRTQPRLQVADISTVNRFLETCNSAAPGNPFGRFWARNVDGRMWYFDGVNQFKLTGFDFSPVLSDPNVGDGSTHEFRVTLTMVWSWLAFTPIPQLQRFQDQGTEGFSTVRTKEDADNPRAPVIDNMRVNQTGDFRTLFDAVN